MGANYLDYAGRTVDVLAFRASNLIGVTQSEMSLLDEFTGGEVCTGIQKLAQFWLLEFLTEEGSVLYFPESGCGFMKVFRLGGMHSELDVFQQFNLASPAIQRNLRNAETANTLPDESFAGAQLTSVVITNDQAVLNIAISSKAGASRQIVLPLNVAP